MTFSVSGNTCVNDRSLALGFPVRLFFHHVNKLTSGWKMVLNCVTSRLGIRVVFSVFVSFSCHTHVLLACILVKEPVIGSPDNDPISYRVDSKSVIFMFLCRVKNCLV